jgi:hypothetical protein
MASQVPPPAEKVSKMFFVITMIGAALWIGTVSVFVLARTP